MQNEYQKVSVLNAGGLQCKTRKCAFCAEIKQNYRSDYATNRIRNSPVKPTQNTLRVIVRKDVKRAFVFGVRSRLMDTHFVKRVEPRIMHERRRLKMPNPQAKYRRQAEEEYASWFEEAQDEA